MTGSPEAWRWNGTEGRARSIRISPCKTARAQTRCVDTPARLSQCSLRGIGHGWGTVLAQKPTFVRWTALALSAVLLSGCAQTNALFDGATGSLAPPSQTARADNAGPPPLPSRRTSEAESPRTDGLLAALPDINFSAQAVAPLSVVADDAPVNVYVRLARQIRRCWLGAQDPRLPGHGFRAEAKPGQAAEAEIDVFEEAPGRKYGPHAFEVKITPQGGGSLVRSTNRRFDEELANTLRADVARWVRGGTGCDAPGRGNA